MPDSSPTPWKFEECGYFWLLDADGNTIFHLSDDYECPHRDDPNAKFILEAVNGRAALIEALRKLKSYNEDIRDGKINYRPEDHIAVAEAVLKDHQ